MPLQYYIRFRIYKYLQMKSLCLGTIRMELLQQDDLLSVRSQEKKIYKEEREAECVR